MTEKNPIESAAEASGQTRCFHCGNRCVSEAFGAMGHAFCCHGCQTVFELLTANGLAEYYKIDARAGVRAPSQVPSGKFAFLDEAGVRQRIVSFSNERMTRVVFRVPAIHCIACVWLLENLFRLNPAIAKGEVNFLRREVTLSFGTENIRLSEVVELLASLGYEPELKFSDLDSRPRNTAQRKLWMQLGVAGFAFGNNMLFAVALYLGVDGVSGPAFQRLVGWISLALAVPVLLFSAQDYFKLAWQGLKRRFLTIEAPIAAGIVVIFGQSAWEVLAGKGVGYFDSFAGLLFFLLCGRMFQQKSYARLAFDRDFKSFFPLSVARRKDGREEHVSLSAIETGDRLLIRNGELVPADARLVSGDAVIDYSFVTGEAEHVALDPGDYLYAGGRQMGPAIEIETLKPVSQSYLTSLWNQDVFKKPAADSLDSLINRYSQRFTKLVVVIALAAAAYWAVADPGKALFAATSVLIVACPCALALAAPFALGTALRALGKIEVFVKSPDVVERMAKIDSVVFDKTGTLTACGAASVEFKGLPLLERTRDWIYSMTRHSTHPHAAHIGQFLRGREMEVRSFVETPGCGMAGMIDGHDVWIGSAAWLASNGVGVPPRKTGSASHVAIDGDYRGVFLLPSAVRTGAEAMIGALGRAYNLALLTGDNAREQERFQKLFGPTAVLRFEQSPLDKLDFVRELQAAGKRALMVGDGLNDAGALKQSDVGVAVVETIGCFSPASDIIMRADNAPRLDAILRFSKDVSRIVKLSFGVSTLYNVVGVSIAASAKLAPIICAILMPLSSITVVAFACGAVSWQARKRGLTRKETR